MLETHVECDLQRALLICRRGGRHHGWQWWTLRGGADVRDVFAVASDEGCPLETFAGSYDDRFRAIDGHLHDVTAIDVVRVSACVCRRRPCNGDRC